MESFIHKSKGVSQISEFHNICLLQVSIKLFCLLIIFAQFFSTVIGLLHFIFSTGLQNPQPKN